MNTIHNERVEYFGQFVDVAYSIIYDGDMVDDIQIISLDPITYMTPQELRHFKTMFIQKKYRKLNITDKENQL